MTALAKSPRMTREQREALDALGSEKRQFFVLYYTGEAKHNATLAAKLAGYSEDTAYSIGSELLNYPEVVRAIEAFDRPVRDKAIMGKREAQRLLTRMVRGEESDVVVTKDGPIDVRPSHHTRNSCLRTLAELRGWNAAKKLDVNVRGRPKDVAEARALLEQYAADLGATDDAIARLWEGADDE